MLIVLLMGFSSGIPLALTGGTLQAWMAVEGVDLKTIGVFSLVTSPYYLKPLWAPFMDRFVPPILGRRRGWILLSQVGLFFGIAIMAAFSPAQSPVMIAVLAVAVAFFSASQDIVLDAYRLEILKPEEYGAGAGTYMLGYRLAMILSGGVALILSDHLTWPQVYLVMAATMLIGMTTCFFAPEPQISEAPPKSLRDAVLLPLAEFFKRPGILEIALFIFLYKLDAVVASALVTPFLLELGFSGTDIGSVFKVYGVVATIAGTLTGGTLMVKWGIQRSLWIFGILQGIAGFMFYWLAHVGKNYGVMVGAISAENFFSGMGTAAYAAFLMSLCNKRFSATQYALLSSVMALTRTIGQAPSGYLVASIGWQNYYLVSIFVALPALLLLTRYSHWMKKTSEILAPKT